MRPMAATVAGFPAIRRTAGAGPAAPRLLPPLLAMAVREGRG